MLESWKLATKVHLTYFGYKSIWALKTTVNNLGMKN